MFFSFLISAHQNDPKSTNRIQFEQKKKLKFSEKQVQPQCQTVP